MILVRHKDNPPKNGQGNYVYVDPDSKMRFAHPYFWQLLKKAKDHRRANNYPIGSHFNQEFEANVCANTPGEICSDLPPVTERVGRFARAMYQWALSGFKVVTEEQANQRQEICQACQYWSGNKGFLKVACEKCGCGGLKLYLSTSKCPDNPPRWNAV